MTVDYDAPRTRQDEGGAESLEEVKAAQAQVAAQQPLTDEPQDAVETDDFELPGADLSHVSLDVEVRPQQADEFVCMGCFLVRHRAQLGDAGATLCIDCV